MRVAIVMAGMPPTEGGTYTFQQGLIDAVQQSPGAHDFVVLDVDQGPHEPAASIPRINLKQAYGGPPAGRFAREVHRLQRRVRRRRKTTVPSPIERAITEHQVDMAWYLAPLGERVQVPFIYTVWDLQHRLQPWFPEVSQTHWPWDQRESRYREMVPRASAVFTGTQAGRAEILQFYGPAPENVRVLPLPTPTFREAGTPGEDGEYLRHYGLEPGYLFYPAQFWAHKNHANLILALELLNRDRSQPLKLVLTGSDKGNADYVRKLLEDTGQAGHVTTIGFVPERDLVALYRQAAALVFPSFFGPDNLPPLEAFALGCPVAAADVQGAAEQLGDCALLFDPRDPAAIAATVRRLLDDKNLRQRQCERALARANGWSPADYVAAVGDFLDDFERVRRSWGPGQPPATN